MTSAFMRLLKEAMDEFARDGFYSEDRLAEWVARLHAALDREMPNDDAIREMLRRSFDAVFNRLVTKRRVLASVENAKPYTIDRVAPELRAELDRRIMAGVSLIRLNREARVQKTLQRFAGWTTSIPAGAQTDVERAEARAAIGREPAQFRYEQRRVAIDQGHKLAAAVTRTVATGAGAIAAIWHSQWRRPGYDFRPDHKERDLRVYAIRGCWAIERGLMKPGPAGYLDDITQPAEEPFCSCSVQYLTSLRSLPAEMLTRAGEAMLQPKAA